MTERHKKEEKDVMLQFRRLWEDFPKGRLIQSESPDFMLYQSAKKSVGIEITRIVRSDEFIPSSHSQSQTDNKMKYFRISRNLVEQAILLKEEKLSAYRKRRANAYWLIIWIEEDDFLRPRIHQSLLNHAFETHFDKVFLLLKSIGLVIELQKSSR